jgi:DNA-binding IclR family transcriptional regulator
MCVDNNTEICVIQVTTYLVNLRDTRAAGVERVELRGPRSDSEPRAASFLRLPSTSTIESMPCPWPRRDARARPPARDGAKPNEGRAERHIRTETREARARRVSRGSADLVNINQCLSSPVQKTKKNVILALYSAGFKFMFNLFIYMNMNWNWNSDESTSRAATRPSASRTSRAAS